VAIKKLKPVESPLVAPEGFEVLPTALLLFQKTTGMLWGNSAFEKAFGAVHAKRFSKERSLGLIRERPLSLQVFTMLGRHEGFAIENSEGKKTPVELKVTQYGDQAQECFLVLVEDVSEKVELENQLIQKHIELQNAFQEIKETQNALIQSAKLASLGEMSSGIAHELNQPLQAIIGFSQELEHVEPLSPTGKEFVGDIISGAKKMAAIIRSLRSFARQSGDEYVDTSLPDALHETLKLMHHTLMQGGIECDVEIQENLPLVYANPIQLEQVFVNLLSNAKDAIESAHVGRGLIRIRVQSKQDAIEVSIKDDGCGIPENVQQKIFDPFFTTKEVGKGTGLGLSISYGILQKLGADVKVFSNVGEGTEFIIRIPLQKTSQKPNRKAASS